MTTRTIAVVSGGSASRRPLGCSPIDSRMPRSRGSRRRAWTPTVSVFELRDIARDITNNLLTGFPSPKLAEVSTR